MDIVLSLAVAGVMIGTLYGLLGFTLTLTFRSTGVLSFAPAGFALIAAYMYAGFSCRLGSRGNCAAGDALLPPYLAALVSVATVTVAALVVERGVIRPLQHASATTKSIATAAVLALSSGVMLQVYGPTPRSVPDGQQLVPPGGFSLFDVFIDWQRTMIFVVSLVLVAVLTAALRKTWFGLGVRAAGQLPDVARLVGVNPVAVSRFNWGLSGALSGLAGVLIASITLVNIGTFSFFLVKALAATLIGGLVSLPLTFLGGVAIGLVETLLPHFWTTAGSSQVGIAALVLGFLYLNRNRLHLLGSATTASVSVQEQPPGRLGVTVARSLSSIEQVAVAVPRPLRFLAAAGVVALPLVDEYYAAVGVNVLYWILLALSLFVITGLVGQPSLMQMGFVGVGAFAIGTGLDHGLPVPVGLVIGVTLCFLLGLAVGYISLRFRGLEFAIVSLTLGAAISEFLLTRPELSSQISGPSFFGIDLLRSRNAFLVMGALTALAFFAVRNLRRCGWGRSLHAIEEGQDTLLRHVGVNTTSAEVVLFAISGAIAGLAGCTYALIVNLFGSFEFIPLYSIAALLAAVVGGLRSLWGPLVAGVLFGYGPYLVENVSVDAANAYPQIVSSLLALVLIVRCPGGLASVFTWARETASRSPVGAVDSRFRGLRVGLDGSSASPLPSREHAPGNGRRPLHRPERLSLRRPSRHVVPSPVRARAGEFRGHRVGLDRGSVSEPRNGERPVNGWDPLRRPEPVRLRRPSEPSAT
jgi:ABC-type branched-subunit amino acid transport system permease subunit